LLGGGGEISGPERASMMRGELLLPCYGTFFGVELVNRHGKTCMMEIIKTRRVRSSA
jgi:hypothetical protein